MKTKKFHYAWIILIACSLLSVAGIGIMSNTSSSFITAVCSDRNLSFVEDAYQKDLATKQAELIKSGTNEADAKTQATEYAGMHYIATAATPFSMYMVLQGIIAGITFFFVNKLLKKFDIRPILLVGTIVVVGTFALMSTFTQLWQWYLAGIVLGMSTAVIWFLPGPIMVGNWFRKHLGLAMGLFASTAYIAGMIMNPIISKVFVPYFEPYFEQSGWRGAYLAIAALSLVISLCVIFLVRTKPEDMGLQALGADDMEVLKALAAKNSSTNIDIGIDIKKALRSSLFVMIAIAAALVAYNATHMNVLGNYGVKIGLGANYAYIVSAVLFGGIVFRLFYGLLNDKIGIRKTFALGIILDIVGFGGLIFADIFKGDAKTAQFVAFAGAFLIGSMSAISSTLVPILVRTSFGGKNFAAAYGALMGVISLVGSTAVFIVPLIAGKFSYSHAFVIAIVFCLVIWVCAFSALKKSAELVAEAKLAEATAVAN